MTRPELPSGPPWDLPLAEAPLVFVDLEMTGLDATRDRVIEVCIERVRGDSVVDRLHTLVRPETMQPDSSVGNTHVHGISREALLDAPTFAEIAQRAMTLLEGGVFVAHGASWDIAFLETELRRAGHEFTIPFHLDTLNLSRRSLGLSKHSLEALREHFQIDGSRAHRADADVHALREVFRRCVAALEPATPRDLWQVRIAEGKARDQILAECKEAIARGEPVSVTYRRRAKPPETTKMMLIDLLLGLDPPRVIGYQLPGRGRRELRADRILRIEASSE